MSESGQTVTISYKSILRVVIVLLGLTFLYVIREVLGLLFVSVILAAAIDPWVTWFHKRKIPRGFAIIIIYTILFLIMGITVAALIPPLKEQVGQLQTFYPQYYDLFVGEQGVGEEVPVEPEVASGLTAFDGNLAQFSFGAVDTLWNVGGGAFAFFGLLVLIFYMTIQENGMERVLRAVVPEKQRKYAVELFERIQDKMGLWLRAQLFLMLAVGIMTYIGLTALGVKYALVLALLAGLTELIPFIGPIIGAIPAVFVALSTSLPKAAVVALLYFVVQWLENNILVPKIMKRAVGLNPVVVIAAILIGFEFGGIAGAIVAVPVAAALAVFLGDVFDLQAFEERVFKDGKERIVDS